MDQLVNDFVHLLRRRGLRISPAETLDALRALCVVGIGEREGVRDSLRATLVKNAGDIETFERLFTDFFGLRALHEAEQQARIVDEHDHGATPSRIEVGADWEDQEEVPQSDPAEHSHDQGETPNLRRYFAEERLRPASNIHADPNRMRLSLFSRELILNRKPGAMESVLQRISHQLRVRRARGILNPGPLVPATNGEELPLDIVATELQGLIDHLHDLNVDERLLAHLDAQAANILAGLPALIAAMRERERRLDPRPGELSAIRREALVRMMRFSAAEERELEFAIRRLARRIRGANSRRLYEDRVGRISMSHTLRRNLAYGGAPFQPVLRRRRKQRPRLVVLCDLSLSTRNLARFWLHLLYQIQSLFSKVRTYAYVADLVEVTQLFEERAFDAAVQTLFSGRVLDVDVNSDFGRAAARFVDEHAGAVTRRTTVVVLGDGRNNGKDPNLVDFEHIARNAREVIWMTPEPRWGWSVGSCDMPTYERHCHRIEIVRNVEQLAIVAEGLVHARA